MTGYLFLAEFQEDEGLLLAQRLPGLLLRHLPTALEIRPMNNWILVDLFTPL